MKTLVIGFDSAWSARNAGAIVAVLKCDDGSYKTLGDPQVADFPQATRLINKWQEEHSPDAALIFIDQPIIVANQTGQRDVENIVSSPVGKRYGGVQPANRNKAQLFGALAPIWPFLGNFCGAADPTKLPSSKMSVIETYPVLAMIAMDWVLEDNHPNSRSTGRLPKYNPVRRGDQDWKHVCNKAAKYFAKPGLECLEEWLTQEGKNQSPRKRDQDCLDSCICVLVGIHMAEGKECLITGDMKSGYMVVPYGESLHAELNQRCTETGRDPKLWVQQFKVSKLNKP